LDPDVSPDEQEEKARLISQVLELQNTLDGKINLLYLKIGIHNPILHFKACQIKLKKHRGPTN
jgi:hypothetical protein